MEIVGNRYRLTKRQRLAVRRVGASKQAVEHRQAKHRTAAEVKGQDIAIDGFNLLILLESALSGAFILRGRDGAYRDLASVSGSYKRVRQTAMAISSVDLALRQLEVAEVTWYLDAPISNSGRLRGLLLDHHPDWRVELVADPDQSIIGRTDAVAISGDSLVIDESVGWFNLAETLFSGPAYQARILRI